VHFCSNQKLNINKHFRSRVPSSPILKFTDLDVNKQRVDSAWHQRLLLSLSLFELRQNPVEAKESAMLHTAVEYKAALATSLISATR
jgi:hypothetical protein